MTMRRVKPTLGQRVMVIASAVLLIVGCTTASTSPGAPTESGASGAPQTGNLPDLGLKNVTTETAQARGATIGPAGGTVTATADDGTTYSLAIPAGAIDKPTQIAVYPVSRVAGLPGGSTLTAGAQFAPEGLLLQVPATLTIGLKAAADPATVHGLTWNADAADLHAYPAGISGSTATIKVYHFSGAGLGNPPLVAINNCTTQRELDQAIADAIDAAANNRPNARNLFTDSLKLCYANFVKDLLVAGASLSNPDDIIDAAKTRDAYDSWYGGVFFWAGSFFPGFTVSPELAASRTLAATFLRSWFDSGNAECVAHAGDPSGAAQSANFAINIPHRWAPQWGIDSRTNRLDYETLLTDLCFKVVIDPARTFSGSKPGDAGTVTVPVGYSIQGGTVGHDIPIHVSLKETGGSSTFAEGDAPSDGNYSAAHTWPASVNPLRIDVLASLVDYPDIAVFDRITKHPGSKIALSVLNGSNQLVIEVIDEDGTNVRTLTSGPRDVQPSWSPDGRKVAFARITAGGSTTESIQVVNADGTGLTALTSGPFDSSPEWAPDGSRIAFIRATPASGPIATINLMNPDGSNVVDTGVKVQGSKISWSPDSKQIAYVKIEEPSSTFRLWILTVATGSSTQLSTPACEPYGTLLPDWSSTGTIGFFCVTHGNPNGSNWIATISGTGGGYQAVTGNLIGKAVTGLTWSPDGTKLAIVEDGRIVVGDMAGGGTGTTLPSAGGKVVAIDWGP